MIFILGFVLAVMGLVVGTMWGEAQPDKFNDADHIAVLAIGGGIGTMIISLLMFAAKVMP